MPFEDDSEGRQCVSGALRATREYQHREVLCAPHSGRAEGADCFSVHHRHRIRNYSANPAPIRLRFWRIGYGSFSRGLGVRSFSAAFRSSVRKTDSNTWGEVPVYVVGLLIVAVSMIATAFAPTFELLLIYRALGDSGPLFSQCLL